MGRMKGGLILLGFFLLLIMPGINSQAYDTQVIDNAKVYISSPRDIHLPGCGEIEIISKQYAGDIDFVLGFNNSLVKPTSAYLYKPYNTTYNFTCVGPDFIYNFTDSYFICYKDNITYINESLHYNYTIIYQHDYEVKIGPTFYWNKTIDWVDISGVFDSVNYDFGGMNKWYYKKDIPIQEDVLYKIKVCMEPVSNVRGKYWIAIKPSSDTIHSAITNDRFLALDPWYDTQTAEDFTTYSETDPGADITVVNASHITFTNLDMGQEAYVVRDYGPCYFDGDFHHNFTYGITAVSGNPTTVVWGLSNQSGEVTDWTQGINFQIYNDGTGGDYAALEVDDPYAVDFGAMSQNNNYVYIHRVGGTVTSYVYTDRDHTSLDDSFTVSDSGCYRYLYALSSWEQTGRSSTGWVADLYANITPGGCTPYLNVSLGTPSNNNVNNSATINFTYTPIIECSIHYGSACLYANANTTWEQLVCNTSTITNNTLNSISYTFDDIEITDFEWNIIVTTNQTSEGDATNYTLTVVNGSITSIENTTYDTNSFDLNWTTPNRNYEAVFYSLNGGTNQSMYHFSTTDYDDYTLWNILNYGNYIDVINSSYINITHAVDQDYGAYAWLWLNMTELGLPLVRGFDVNWTQLSTFGNQTSIGPPAVSFLSFNNRVGTLRGSGDDTAWYVNGTTYCEIQGFPGGNPTYDGIRNYEAWDDGGFQDDGCDCHPQFFDWGYMRLWRSEGDLNNVTLEAYNDSAHTIMHCACSNTQDSERIYEIIQGFSMQNVSGSDIRTWSGAAWDMQLGIENKSWWNTTFVAPEGQNYITVYMNNTDGDLVSHTVYFTVTTLSPENYTTYTEVDPDSYIDVLNDTWINFSTLNATEVGYVYKSYGQRAFEGNFSHNLTFNVTNTTALLPSIMIWGLSNNVSAVRNWTDGMYVYVYGSGTDGGDIYLGNVTSGTHATCYFDTLNNIFMNVRRQGNNVTFAVYNDSRRLPEFLTDECSILDERTFEYIYAMSTWEQGGGRLLDGYVTNLYLGPLPDKLIDLNYPTDASIVSSLTFDFNYTPISNASFDGCWLFTNETGSWLPSASNTSSITNATSNVISHTFSDFDRTIVYGMMCNDTDTDPFYSLNYTFSLNQFSFNVTIYDEMTGDLFNVSSPDSMQMTVYCTNQTDIYNITGNYSIELNVNCDFLFMELQMLFGTDEYFRTLIPEGGNVDFYMIDLNTHTKVDINLYIDDLTGRFYDSILSIRKPINNVTNNITQARFDAEHRILSYLVTNEWYSLSVFNGVEERVVGYILADADGDKTLRITSVEMLPGLTTVYGSVSWAWYANATGEYIQFMYNDSALDTLNVSVWIYNSTNTSQLLYSSVGYSSNIIFTYSSVNINQSYIGIFEAWHGEYGELSETTVIIFEGISGDHIPEGIDQVWLMFGGLSFCLFLGLIFGPKHSTISGIAISMAAGLFWAMGWFTGYIGLPIIGFVGTIAILHKLTKDAKGGG